MSPRRDKTETARTGGFALIEVLVAVAVSAVLMLALMRAFAATWSGIGAVRDDAEAMLIARSILFAVAPRANVSEGTQNGMIGRYSWNVAITKSANAKALSTASEEGGENAKLWTPFRFVIVVTAPNGRSTNLESIRLSQTAAR
jgi:type II secretion system protein I